MTNKQFEIIVAAQQWSKAVTQKQIAKYELDGAERERLIEKRKKILAESKEALRIAKTVLLTAIAEYEASQ